MGKTLIAAGLLLAAGAARGQAVTPVAKLDLARFASTWYEVADYPVKSEKKCVRDGLMLFAGGEKTGRLQEVHSCIAKDGFANVQNVNLRLKDKKVADGRLQTSFLFVFHRRQWVLAVAEDYGWALLGSPNHKQLWVLAAQPSLAPEVLAEVKAKAAAEGYDVGKLMMVTQTREGRAR